MADGCYHNESLHFGPVHYWFAGGASRMLDCPPGRQAETFQFDELDLRAPECP